MSDWYWSPTASHMQTLYRDDGRNYGQSLAHVTLIWGEWCIVRHYPIGKRLTRRIIGSYKTEEEAMAMAVVLIRMELADK